MRLSLLRTTFAEFVFTNPLAVTVYDRHENGEHRWHTLEGL